MTSDRSSVGLIGLGLLGSAIADRLLEHAEQLGYGNADNSGIIEAFRTAQDE